MTLVFWSNRIAAHVFKAGPRRTQGAPIPASGTTNAYFRGLARGALTSNTERGQARVWEDVASGYWTLPVKQSSGLVSHYGSTPSSSARPLDKT